MTATPEAEAAFTRTFDGARSAIALVRALRAGDRLAALDLTATLDDSEKGYLVGALASLANQALNAAEDCARLAGSNVTADDILSSMTLGFATDE